MNQQQVDYCVRVVRESLDNIDRDLLNITTLCIVEGDDLLDFSIKTMLEAREKAIYLLQTTNSIMNRARMTSNLDLTEFERGIKSLERFLKGIDGNSLSVPL